MAKRMLIDSTHAEETRVVVLDGNRLEDYDVETSTKQQLKGNIYLAKVVRVEPSLQAAFVEYGGNRHGFLAFGEIHPDYYQIPVADRQRLIEMQEAEAREDEEAEDRAAAREASGARPLEIEAPTAYAPPGEISDEAPPFFDADAAHADVTPGDAAEGTPEVVEPLDAHAAESVPEAPAELPGADMAPESPEPAIEAAGHDEQTPAETMESVPQEPPPEQIGGQTEAEQEYQRPERAPPRFLRNYKIQEVIRRRQILLIQVVKEERGSKGAALTTYISLAGRFSVLMPNSPRGGGISRKITSAADRRRLKEVTAELDLPRGMGLIVRTAGANRPKPEIIRDCEYLLNQWDQIRELTMKSVAPALIYEEASLIKRAIRDVYSRDVDDILVDGEVGWRAARDFMRMLMPTHAKKVQLWKEPTPLFAKAQVEAQLDAMLVPTVQLKSGGYLVINQTEALVAIDVNSGRSTRERGIEDTAFRTNMEAAEEAARQLRLRDLAGLIVIDFIDMESRRNNAAVEKKLKDALKNDRARIQIGSISHFGLLEMSRQRLRPSLAETSFVMCPHCSGTGTVRSTESAALHVLRAIEEEGGKRRAAEIVVHVAGPIALYILNHKRVRLAEVEQRFGMTVTFAADDTLLPPATRIDRVRAATTSELPAPISQLAPPEPFEDEDEMPDAPEEATAEEEADDSEAVTAQPGETAEEAEQRGKRRRRRRRGGRRDEPAETTVDRSADAGPADAGPADASPSESPSDAPIGEGSEDGATQAPNPARAADAEVVAEGADEGERKRRGRRGGRRRRREPGEAGEAALEGAAEEPEATTGSDTDAYKPAYVAPAYAGPTPADPFGGSSAYDIFDAIEQAEQERALSNARPAPAAAEAPPPRSKFEMRADDIEMLGQVVSTEAPEPEMPAASAPAPVSASASASAEPVAAEPASSPEPVSAPPIQPVVIGEAESAGEKKKGWWRR